MIIQFTRRDKTALGKYHYFYLEYNNRVLAFVLFNRTILWVEFKK